MRLAVDDKDLADKTQNPNFDLVLAHPAVFLYLYLCAHFPGIEEPQHIVYALFLAAEIVGARIHLSNLSLSLYNNVEQRNLQRPDSFPFDRASYSPLSCLSNLFFWICIERL